MVISFCVEQVFVAAEVATGEGVMRAVDMSFRKTKSRVLPKDMVT